MILLWIEPRYTRQSRQKHRFVLDSFCSLNDVLSCRDVSNSTVGRNAVAQQSGDQIRNIPTFLCETARRHILLVFLLLLVSFEIRQARRDLSHHRGEVEENGVHRGKTQQSAHNYQPAAEDAHIYAPVPDEPRKHGTG